jgi:hypothetical protein
VDAISACDPHDGANKIVAAGNWRLRRWIERVYGNFFGRFWWTSREILSARRFN